MSCASRNFWTAFVVWRGVLCWWWVGGIAVTGTGDAAQKVPSRHCIITGWLPLSSWLVTLISILWLFRLQVSVKMGIFIVLDAIFHKLYHVLWALGSSACRKFRAYGVWALLCLIKSNCMVLKLLFKHPKHVFHPVVIHQRFCFPQNILTEITQG